MNKVKLKLNQKALAIFAIKCAEHVLHYFEKENRKDKRPREAIKTLKKWIHTGVFKMSVIRGASLAAHAAARKAKSQRAVFAARAAGQAVAVAHVPTHAFGVSYYALKIAALNNNISKELAWQEKRFPKALKREWNEWKDKKLPKNIRLLIRKETK